MTSPTHTEVRAAREAAGLSQEAAGALVHVARITWARWEAEGKEARAMHPAFWELFRLKSSITPESRAGTRSASG